MAVRVRLAHVGNVANLILALFHRLNSLPAYNIKFILKTTLRQIRFGGWQAVPLIGAIAALIGGVAIIEAFSLLSG